MNPDSAQMRRAVTALVPFVQEWKLSLNPEDVYEMAAAVLQHFDSEQPFDEIDQAVREQLAGANVVSLHELPALGSGDQGRAMGLEPAAAAYGAEHPEVYAGAVLCGGHLYVGFTHDATDHLGQLRRRTDNPQWLRAFRADYTYVELERTMANLTADVVQLRQHGIDISATGIDPYHNRVFVTLPKRNEGQEATLIQRYGPQLAFDEGMWSPARP